MTDALETTAAFGDPGQTAVMAAHAGADLLMFTSDADAATAVEPLRDLLGYPRWRQRFAIAVERVREPCGPDSPAADERLDLVGGGA